MTRRAPHKLILFIESMNTNSTWILTTALRTGRHARNVICLLLVKISNVNVAWITRNAALRLSCCMLFCVVKVEIVYIKWCQYVVHISRTDVATQNHFKALFCFDLFCVVLCFFFIWKSRLYWCTNRMQGYTNMIRILFIWFTQ